MLDVVTVTGGRRLRTDAARNVERILRAAREVYAELGPDAAIDVIAARAGVGERTLYRRFPTKGDLVRAALNQSIDDNLSPAIKVANRADDPLQGLTRLIETATALGAREHHLLAAARKTDALSNISDQLDEALSGLLTRAQRDGLVREDLVAEDLSRIMFMLNSVLWTMDPASGGWRRYVALLLDAICTADRRGLPPPVPIRFIPNLESWPL
jgi:AcrR family transcriptional regulator